MRLRLPLVFVMTLSSLMILPASATERAPGTLALDVGTSHFRLDAHGFDGSGEQQPESAEANDVSSFNEAIVSFDDPSGPGRTGTGEAEQNTLIDPQDGTLTVGTAGEVSGVTNNPQPDPSAVPFGEGSSVLSITIEVTDAPVVFALTGTVETNADAENVDCSTVTLTPPAGDVIEVASPSTCGGIESSSVSVNGDLGVGTHTFSVEAHARAASPTFNGPLVAIASFDLRLVVGCSVIGTDSDDALAGTAEADVICGLGGDDTLTGGDGNDLLLGGDGADTLHGDGGDDHLEGGGGNDSIFGGFGLDTVFAGDGSDIVEGGVGNDLLAGGEGNDTIVGDELADCDGAVTIPGTVDDQILGDGGNDDLFGCSGNDVISGGTGDDEIAGNDGGDTLSGEKGSDRLLGQAGPDSITGGQRKDVLNGGGANDELLARDGVHDVVRGGPGNDDRARVDAVDEVTTVEVLL